MRKLVLLFSMILIASFQLSAQNQRVTGTVIDQDGSPMGGVLVAIEGSSTGGTITEANGNYSISAPANSTLSFSFFGMMPQSIAVSNRSTIDVTLQADATTIDNVVVTALGIARAEKALAYSVDQVGADELERGGDRNLLSSVQGKFAGVNIATSSGAPGSSNRVVLRGYRSINGSNEPLWVVDGIPMNNDAKTGTDWNEGSVDYGNRGNDINPDDIASMSILKGSAASVLYGSRASNGVILVTTKSGQVRDKVLVEYSNDTKFTRAAYLHQMQNRYGQGILGVVDLTENSSWGPKFNNENRVWGNVVDGDQLYKRYRALPTNIQDFYETGLSETNSINVSGGQGNTTFFMSYANTFQNGILPTDRDFLKRNAVSMRGSTKGKFLTATASVNYTNKKVSQAQGGGGTGSLSIFNNLIQMPVDISVVDMKDYTNRFFNIDNYYTPYGITNPYYTMEEDGNLFNEDHVFGNLQLSGKITDWLDATVRVGNDYSSNQEELWRAVAIPKGNNEGSFEIPGVYEIGSAYSNEFSLDAFVQFNPYLNENFNLSGMAGYNLNARRLSDNSMRVTGLDLPGFYNIRNSASTPEVEQFLERRRMIGAYLNVDLDWKNTVFLNVAMRNDWSSTLPQGKNSFFYPSVGISASLTDAFPALKRVMTFAKVRASYGETGNDAQPYALRSVFAAGEIDNAFGDITFPLGGVNAYEVANRIGNQALKPERTKEFELGFDFRFLNNRLGIDLSYYNGKSIDQILAVPMASSSGYTSQWKNMGKISNKGIEIALNATPVRTRDFSWDLTFTFSRNRNMVLQLADGVEEIFFGGISSGVGLFAIVGQPMGTFKGLVPLTVELDSQMKPVTTAGTGKEYMVVDANGKPVTSSIRGPIGNIQADFKAGVATTLRWRDIALSAVVDGQKGGVLYSGTASTQYFVGTAPKTLFNDRQPFVVSNSVQRILDPNDSNNTKYYENTTPVTVANFTNFYTSGDPMEAERSLLVSRTNIRLREVVISYTFPARWFENTPLGGIQLSATGHNLLMWRPDSNRFVDPELSTRGNNIAGEFGEMHGHPAVKTYGFNLKVTF